MAITLTKKTALLATTALALGALLLAMCLDAPRAHAQTASASSCAPVKPVKRSAKKGKRRKPTQAAASCAPAPSAPSGTVTTSSETSSSSSPAPPPNDPPPNPNCPLSQQDSTIGMTLPSACTQVASDTASNPDPNPFWGETDCADSSRQTVPGSGGDTHPTGLGASQGNNSYRQLTAMDGDNVWGERCEIGKNDNRNGPTVFYYQGMRRVTYASLRLPSNFPLDSNSWQVVLQMKQTEPSDVGGSYPALALDAYQGQWYFMQANQGSNDKGLVWQAPAQLNKWTRFAFDVTYSTDPNVGSVRIYADLNNDGDFSDSGETSSLMHMSTLQPEMPGSTADGYNTGDPVPSHLRTGLYHDSSIPCPPPSGCSTQVDNVQVIRA
jgi:polysaccharide lyase-like protein